MQPVRACVKVRTERCLNQHALEELLDVGRDTQSGHGVEHAERMAALKEFVGVALM